MHLLLLSLLLSILSSGLSTCDTSWCTSLDFEGGFDCYVGDIDSCSCSEGSSLLTGNEIEYNGVIYLEYTCCDSLTSNDDEVCGNYDCITSRCTSPDGKGGDDCFVSDTESCPCSKGSALLTGYELIYSGETYLQYTCCTSPDATDVGKFCVNKQSSVAIIIIVCVCLLIACFLYFWFRNPKKVNMDNNDNQVVPQQGVMMNNQQLPQQGEMMNYQQLPQQGVMMSNQ
jgi:hypothetical protein